jgi:hypothetical protein
MPPTRATALAVSGMRRTWLHQSIAQPTALPVGSAKTASHDEHSTTDGESLQETARSVSSLSALWTTCAATAAVRELCSRPQGGNALMAWPRWPHQIQGQVPTRGQCAGSVCRVRVPGQSAGSAVRSSAQGLIARSQRTVALRPASCDLGANPHRQAPGGLKRTGEPACVFAGRQPQTNLARSACAWATSPLCINRSGLRRQAPPAGRAVAPLTSALPMARAPRRLPAS